MLPRSEREARRDSSASRSSSGLGGWYVYQCFICATTSPCNSWNSRRLTWFYICSLYRVTYSSSSKALGAKSGKKKKKGGWAALGKFLSKRNSGQPESESEDRSEDDDEEGEGEGPYEDGDDAVEVDSGYDDDDAGGGEQVEEELKPGLYRALYAFDPEGTAEMALVEDQIVRVIARGGGVGWAIVERPPEKGEGVGGFGLEAAGQALVPESYLEPYQLDDEDEYDD